jgi:hypothetical protein
MRDVFYPADGVVLFKSVISSSWLDPHFSSALRRTTPSRRKRVPPLLCKEGSWEGTKNGTRLRVPQEFDPVKQNYCPSFLVRTKVLGDSNFSAMFAGLMS